MFPYPHSYFPSFFFCGYRLQTTKLIIILYNMTRLLTAFQRIRYRLVNILCEIYAVAQGCLWCVLRHGVSDISGIHGQVQVSEEGLFELFRREDCDRACDPKTARESSVSNTLFSSFSRILFQCVLAFGKCDWYLF